MKRNKNGISHVSRGDTLISRVLRSSHVTRECVEWLSESGIKKNYVNDYIKNCGHVNVLSTSYHWQHEGKRCGPLST